MKVSQEKRPQRTNLLQRILYAFAAVLFLGGVGALSYPYVADHINELHESKMYSEYVDMVHDMGSDQIDSMFGEARAFNQTLLTNGERWLPGGIDEDRYYSILDTTGTGIIGYIEIPVINVRLPIYHGTDESVLQIAVGHMIGSSFPIGERGTHSVLSGHNGLMSASIFTELDKVAIGDPFYITVLGNKLEYRVTEINVVLPDDFNYFGVSPDRDSVTLVTCTPFGVNDHRLLVRGDRIDYSKEENRMLIRFD